MTPRENQEYKKYRCLFLFLMRPPTVSDHLCSATSFLKYEKFLLQISIFETSGMQLPLLNDFDHSFRAKGLKFVVMF